MKRAWMSGRLVAVLAIAGGSAACDRESLPEPDGTGPATSTPIATSTPEPTSTVDVPPTSVEPPAPTGFPCDVRDVLQTYCANCHAGRLYYGPNFTTREQLFLPASDLYIVKSHPIAPGTFGEHMATALRDDTMPPVYYGRIVPSPEERQLVIDWIGAGMPGGDCGALSAP